MQIDGLIIDEETLELTEDCNVTLSRNWEYHLAACAMKRLDRNIERWPPSGGLIPHMRAIVALAWCTEISTDCFPERFKNSPMVMRYWEQLATINNRYLREIKAKIRTCERSGIVKP
jgi:hypothetical protein